MLPIALSDPCCHGNEIWDKMGYISARVRDFCEIFAPVGGFSGMCHRMLPIAFFPTHPRCHGNEIWDKIGYSSVRVRDFCAYRGVFGDGPSSAANCIFSRPTPVAMATKFGTKLATTLLA